MNRRNFMAATGTASLLTLTGCFWDQYFDLSWDEEVQLLDDRVIVIKLKYTYERLQRGFTRYSGRNILRESTITFNAGGTTGSVTQSLKGGWPLSLEQVDGNWYMVFYWNSGWSPSLLGGQNWGVDQNGSGQYVGILQGNQFKSIAICSLPLKVQTPNLRFLRDNVADLAAFDGKLITLQDKQSADQRPSNPSEASIQRPVPRSNFTCQPSTG